MPSIIPTDRPVTYALQFRRCRRLGCGTCKRAHGGHGHGPYWFAYWREGRTLRSGYVGKEQPPGEAAERARARAAARGVVAPATSHAEECHP